MCSCQSSLSSRSPVAPVLQNFWSSPAARPLIDNVALSLDRDIDELYKASLDDFVRARDVLAKSLSGPDAARVKRLPKPTVVPWAVNQVYWHARSIYDRVRKTGEQLRSVQIAALKGRAARAADLREANEAQRRAIADAVAAATKLADEAGAHPSADTLTRTFEALSLATDLPEQPGRLTRPLQPAGFEALSGVSLPALSTASSHVGDSAPARDPASAPPHVRTSAPSPGRTPAPTHARAPAPSQVRIAPSPPQISARERLEAERARARQARVAAEEARAAAAEARRHQEAIRKAEQAVERAQAVEARARRAWERAKREAEEAQAAVERLKSV